MSAVSCELIADSSFFACHPDPVGRVLAPGERGFDQREEVLGTEQLAVREGHDACGQRGDAAGAEVGERVAVDRLAQPLHEVAAAVAVGLREDERELVAAIAGYEVRSADLALQDGAEL